MDAIGLTIACGLIQIVGSKSKVCFPYFKSIGQAFHKAVFVVLTNDLMLVTVLSHYFSISFSFGMSSSSFVIPFTLASNWGRNSSVEI